MTKLSNIGYHWKFIPEEVRRFMFCLTKKANGDENSVTLANAALLSAWQTLINTYNFDDDTTVKVVPSPVVFAVNPERGEEKVFDENNYFRQLANGDYDVGCIFYDLAPKQVKGLKALRNYNISVYLITSETQVLGISDGTNLVPIKIQNISVQDYGIIGSDSVSQVAVKFRLKSPDELEDLVAVSIENNGFKADVTSDVDFFPMRDVTGTVSAPAVTGCDVILKLDNIDPNDPGTAIYMTDDNVEYDDITFVDLSDDSETTLASAGSLTYNAATHKHTINETNLLTTGHSYRLEIKVSGYDPVCDTVVVP